MSDESKAKIADMHVSGKDGEVQLELVGTISQDEVEKALQHSKLLTRGEK